MIISRPILLLCVVLIAVMLSVGISSAQEYSLEDFYRIALKRSERIKISEEDLYIAERVKDKAVSVLLPKLSAFGSYTKYSKDKRSSTGSVIQPNDSTSWGIRLDQSFSISGREITAFNISKEGIEKSKYDLYAVKEAYIFNVASAYYDVLRAKKAVEIAKSNFDRMTKHRDAAVIRLKVGEVTKTDVLRAEAELSGAQAELIKSENNLRLAKAMLARVVGLNEDFTIKEPIDSREHIHIVDNLDFLKQTALTERAELKALGLQKKVVQQQVGYIRGAYWPTLSIEGVYTGKNEDPSSTFLNKESIYGGIRLNFPFFEGGLRKAEVREAEAKQRQVELLYEDLKKSISIEVENAYLDFQTQKGVLKSFEDQRAFAMDNYNSVSRQYQFGLANSIDVIDANTLLIASERQLADANYNYQLALIRLQRVTGQMLKTVVAKVQGGQH
ncbi:outer membrane efflux protein [Dissulfurispira thermophila]|uniref:Outer membrane efflux protein n=2 Tax=root TaxID=1 RepID=A0A7G1H3J4_9BACT|nr:TolC family protein [Dissulfurispira thermophila]BCB96749.1 outer membrane efflux protein [Dissulfurispira thermophila]